MAPICRSVTPPSPPGVRSRFAVCRTQRICSARESTAFGIRESQASTAEALLQQPILFLEVLDHIELPAINPASKQSQEELQWLDGGKHPGKYGPLRTMGPADCRISKPEQVTTLASVDPRYQALRSSRISESNSSALMGLLVMRNR